MLDRHQLAVGRLPHLLAGLGVDDPFALGPVLVEVSLFLDELGLALDVDSPAGEPGRQPGVLAFLADGQRQLIVRHDDFGHTGVLVDANLFDLGRRQRLHDEVGGVIAERHDVDLLAAQLVDDHADPGPAGPDTRADRVDVAVVGPHRDLGAGTGLTGARLDLDDTIGDLRHLELEQALDESRVGTADHDLGALGRLADLDDVGLDPGVGFGAFVGHLLGLRQQGLDPAEVEQRIAAVALLDDAGDDVTLAAGVLLVLHLALGLTDALVHHLLDRLRRDTAEVFGRDVELGAGGLTLLVEFLGHDPEIAVVGVDDHPGVLVGVGHALVRGLERIGERGEQRVDGDALVDGEGLQRVHHVGVAHDVGTFWLGEADGSSGEADEAGGAVVSESDFLPVDFLVVDFGALPGFGVGPHSNTVRARSMSW